MGAEQSTLEKKGYVLEKQKQISENTAVATKGDDKYIIKKIIINQKSRNSDPGLMSEIEILKTTSHPHIVSAKNSFQDQDIYYVVMDYCQGENLATKIRGMSQPPEESEVLSWIVEICMALRTIHEKGLLHKHLTPETIFFTEHGTVYLGEFGNIYENSKTTESNQMEAVNYFAPEVFKEFESYDAKSDIWSVGCILYELCTLKPAFSAETAIKLMPKMIGGPYPHLPDQFSSELCELLNDIFIKDCQSRPMASEILGRPFMIKCLSEKCKTTVEELLSKLDNLRAVADSLERVHQGATIGSLTGGVIGAVGGVTSIVGLALAPFTLGASLIVTGIGVGVGLTGGVTASVSNITNMVNQSSDRKAVQNILKEFEEKIRAVVTWLQEISNGLHTLRSKCDLAAASYTHSDFNENNLFKIGGSRVGKGVCGIAEVVRHLRVKNIGNIAAQASRAVRVAEVATGALSGLFVAVDIFFIAMDARELHNIRQAKTAEEKGATGSESVSETEISDFEPTSDQAAQVPNSLMQEVKSGIVEPELMSDGSETQDQCTKTMSPIRSEIMKFVQSIRQTADKLQKVLDEFKSIISSINSLGDMENLEWQDME
ncbi:uncharacterized protein [Pempheris klunzingeri]|uniref:uncharacterized protein n=1 Tax=Pempheris klunzingeri TaxID=3127111 RepID=UPI00397F3933